MYRTKEKKAFEISKYSNSKNDFDIWDLARAMISFDHLWQIVDAFETLNNDKETFGGLQVINFRNRFMIEPTERWQDVMIHLIFIDDSAEDRLICEVQFSIWKLTMTRKDLGGHEIFRLHQKEH